MKLSQYYAGRTLDDVAGAVGRLAASGIGSCVSLLPELRLHPRGVALEKANILAILPGLAERNLSADLTVKPSQLGQRWSRPGFRGALAEIASQAAWFGSFVWIDMEGRRDVDPTIEDFLMLRREHPNLGLCLQTYLRRTESDLRELLRDAHPIRLVKGYYRVRPPHAFDTWAETTASLSRLLVPLIERSSKPALGTHDESVLAEAGRVLDRTPRPEFEFQLFLGAKPGLAERMAGAGMKTRVYVPYGRLLRYFLHTLPNMDLSRNLQRVLRRPVIR